MTLIDQSDEILEYFKKDASYSLQNTATHFGVSVTCISSLLSKTILKKSNKMLTGNRKTYYHQQGARFSPFPESKPSYDMEKYLVVTEDGFGMSIWNGIEWDTPFEVFAFSETNPDILVKAFKKNRKTCKSQGD